MSERTAIITDLEDAIQNADDHGGDDPHNHLLVVIGLAVRYMLKHPVATKED